MQWRYFASFPTPHSPHVIAWNLFSGPQTKSVRFLSACAAEPVFCTCHLARWSHGVAVSRRLLRALRTRIAHVSALPVWDWAPGLFKAKFIFFKKKHLALWQLHRSYLSRLRLSPAFITWFKYWKGSWHFNVLVSGHEECEKAEVCLHLLKSLWIL